MRHLTSVGKTLLCAAVAGLVGCKSAERQYDIRASNLSCEGANRYAYRAMSLLGYEITAFEPARPAQAGAIEARKQRGGKGELAGKIDIVCEPRQVLLTPHAQSGLFPDLEFARGFYLAFSNLASETERSGEGKTEQPADSGAEGLAFTIKPLPGLEAKLDFGADLQSAGILPVRIKVVNNSRRTYRIDTAGVNLRPAGRSQRVKSLAIARAAHLLAVAAEEAARAGGPPARKEEEFASLLRSKLMTNATLRPGGRAQGFLYFPAGEYAGARAIVEDVETSEAEGFMVEF